MKPNNSWVSQHQIAKYRPNVKLFCPDKQERCEVLVTLLWRRSSANRKGAMGVWSLKFSRQKNLGYLWRLREAGLHCLEKRKLKGRILAWERAEGNWEDKCYEADRARLQYRTKDHNLGGRGKYIEKEKSGGEGNNTAKEVLTQFVKHRGIKLKCTKLNIWYESNS